MTQWSPSAWQQYPCRQAIDYPDKALRDKVIGQLGHLPPLVTTGEVNKLTHLIAAAGRGEAFILQGGDCAESFGDCSSPIISNKIKILLQMSLILLHSLRRPIVRIGRIAGQYAKPRSNPMETINQITLPSYRGDLINAPEFNETARTPNPKRMLEGYGHAAMTLNFIRALVSGGFADLNNPRQWDLSFVHHAHQAQAYQEIVDSLAQSLEFLAAIDGIQRSNLTKIDFYTSHEALNLYYEQALTRCIKGRWYNLATHLPWIGMRTAMLNEAHVNFFAGIDNPIGIKIGPSATPAWLCDLVNHLNPHKKAGRLLLITRFGMDKINDCLPNLIQAVQQTKIPVTWSCDPMHGNTETTKDGYKTRHFDNILAELTQAVTIHQQNHSVLGGVHFELTGENVTECLGGARDLRAEDLKHAYHSLVDPRLNYEQSLEMAIQLSRAFKPVV
ncbi:MAG: 3-deoxy-7-phosphoheptulonate synthase class II [Legionellaceae bacterium]|mgnify:FL=1|nr:3-deoxy-7-phosphoheptulonate synthase class II [Legionellaceae bacterium]HCA89921.1 3-deoxy-7-phosphoheptulonate synthase class II [Legionellales bacterium]|tara:strand:- start:2462 stop:3796 length:1335 start_codon:yes stop_codon:yes gene_type:complete